MDDFEYRELEAVSNPEHLGDEVRERFANIVNWAPAANTVRKDLSYTVCLRGWNWLFPSKFDPDIFQHPKLTVPQLCAMSLGINPVCADPQWVREVAIKCLPRGIPFDVSLEVQGWANPHERELAIKCVTSWIPTPEAPTDSAPADAVPADSASLDDAPIDLNLPLRPSEEQRWTWNEHLEVFLARVNIALKQFATKGEGTPLVQISDFVAFVESRNPRWEMSPKFSKPDAAADIKDEELPLWKQTPIPVTRQQEKIILAAITELKLDPKSLPRSGKGRCGAKSEVRSMTKLTKANFDAAWKRLSEDGRIAYAKKSD